VAEKNEKPAPFLNRHIFFERAKIVVFETPCISGMKNISKVPEKIL
jgi:hypothetical protein